jgi:hypothetical protein
MSEPKPETDNEHECLYHEFAFATANANQFIYISWIFQNLIPHRQDLYIDFKLPRLCSKCTNTEAQTYKTMLREFLQTHIIIHMITDHEPTDMLKITND